MRPYIAGRSTRLRPALSPYFVGRSIRVVEFDPAYLHLEKKAR